MVDPLAPGDVVQLKSGGPAMTVELIDDTGMVACTWMDGPRLERRSFVPATLRVCEPPWPRVKVQQARPPARRR